MPLSKIEVQPRCSLGSSNLQRKKLQKLSSQELREKGMAWVLIGSTQTQDKDDVRTKGATQLKRKRSYDRWSPNLMFPPSHQNHWPTHHLFNLHMPYTPMCWNSSLDMYDFPTYSYFDPLRPYGSLYHGGLSPNSCACWLIPKAEIFSS